MHFNNFPILKRLTFGFFNKLGLDLKRRNLHNSETVLISHIMKYYEIDLVLDVGANVGDYAKSLFDNGYTGMVYSFEPVTEVYETLIQNSKNNERWKIFKYGVGSKEETLEIHISKNLTSSSVLKLTNTSIEAEPNTQFTRSEKINITSLDNFFNRNPLNQHKNLFVKIDVQGYELEVIRGAAKNLSSISFIQAELSIVKLYEGSTTYTEFIKIMEELGFEMFTIIPGFRNPVNGQMLQADGIFINKKLLVKN